MAALSFFFPVVGWILWAVKKDTNPGDAAKCANWARIGFGLYVVGVILSSCSALSGY